MTMSGRVLLLTWCVLAFVGCKKPQSSAAYAQASGAYDVLVAKSGDDAYADPELARIRELLNSVPADSLDIGRANELKARIAQEETEAKARLAATKAAMELAKAGGDVPVFPSNSRPFPSDEPAAPPPPPPAPAVDGGVNLLAPGTEFSLFQTAHPTCLESTGAIEVSTPEGTTYSAVSWVLKDRIVCREEVPELIGNAVLVRAGKVTYVSPLSAFKRELVYPDAGKAGPDAGAVK